MRRPDRDRRIVQGCAKWFLAHARVLPWRTQPRQAYAALVSEVMLQQTQVSRVVERFQQFMSRFPKPEALARAPEAEVLALWSGMGYYRRARNLHAAARQIVGEFGGRVPSEVKDLRRLTGIGPYTAGAIASIVFDRPEPIVDGNIARVLMRLEGKPFPHGSSQGLAWSWRRAAELIVCTTPGQPTRSPASFNEGLMELGATICTPRNPACGRCPLAGCCTTKADSAQHRIPRPRPQTRRRVIYCAAAVLSDSRGRILLEQRGANGMWAGLWQAPTLEAATRIKPEQLQEWTGVASLQRAGAFTHQTSHRDVRFTVWRASIGSSRALRSGRTLVFPKQLTGLGLGSAQRRVIELGLGAGV